MVTDGNDYCSQGVALGFPTAGMLASRGEESKYRSARNNCTFSPARTQDIVLELKVTFTKTSKLRDQLERVMLTAQADTFLRALASRAAEPPNAEHPLWLAE